MSGNAYAPDPLRESAERAARAPAAEAEGESWDYGRLDREADRVAALLVSAGVRPGDRVAALLPRGLAGLAALHGVPRAAATYAPLHEAWTGPELERALDLIGPAVLLCAGTTEERAAAAADRDTGDRSTSDITVLRIDRPHGDSVPGQAAAAAPGRDAPAAAHSILLSSGTSGSPRAVLLSAGNLLASARACRTRLELESSDAWFAALSPAHVGGLALAYRAAVVGCRVVLRKRFDAAELRSLIDQERVTHVSLVPVMLRRLLEAGGDVPPPGRFRCILLGGASCPPDLLHRALDAGWPVALTYGLTEAASQVATAPPALVRQKPGTVGPPLGGTEVRISEEGEIQVRGPTVTLGRAHGGWLRTGDAGRLDACGHLWVTGRLSERIVTGGTTVDPREVEEALRAHPAVVEAAVVGLPDPNWGEIVAAVVVPRPPTERPAGSEIDDLTAELEHHCRGELSAPKRPRRWMIVDALPRNANEKVDPAGARLLFLRRA